MDSRDLFRLIYATTVPASLHAFCRGMLRELSSKYDVIALSSPGPSLDQVGEHEGIRTVGVPMERHIAIGKDLRSLFALIRVFRKERPDMVHSMMPKAGLLCMMAAWWTKVPVRIHTFTGLVWPTSRGLKRIVLKMTDRVTCACATHIIPEGEGVKQDLISGHITKKPLRVLGYGNIRGIDLAHFDRTADVVESAERIRRPGAFTFLFVGRIVGDKGINELVSAFVRLNQSYPDTRLLLVGPFEETLDPVSAETRRLIEDESCIESLGAKKDVCPYYAASDCFVFPSYREGFPNVVIEAGAMGLPAIVTDINGSREIIHDGENGLIVPSRDIEALFQAMKKMREDESLRSRLAQNARPMIVSRFEQSFVRKCLYEFYDGIVHDHFK